MHANCRCSEINAQGSNVPTVYGVRLLLFEALLSISSHRYKLQKYLAVYGKPQPLVDVGIENTWEICLYFYIKYTPTFMLDLIVSPLFM